MEECEVKEEEEAEEEEDEWKTTERHNGEDQREEVK